MFSDVSVPEEFMSTMPEKYVSLVQHIEYGKEAREQRLARNAQTKAENEAKKQVKHAAFVEGRKKKSVRESDRDRYIYIERDINRNI